jgi:TetR/AcrR family transcriptional repressor of nem operon
MPRRSNRTAILELAMEMAQTVGYNGFSYHDLARRLELTTASIHYHFPTKEDLARELMAVYRQRFIARLARIEQDESDARGRIMRFVDLFRETLRAGDRLCLCGMLASEYATLPPSVRDEVRLFFSASESWLRSVLEKGSAEGELQLDGSPEQAGKSIFAALEGAMMAARAFADESRLEGTGAWLLSALSARKMPA